MEPPQNGIACAARCPQYAPISFTNSIRSSLIQSGQVPPSNNIRPDQSPCRVSGQQASGTEIPLPAQAVDKIPCEVDPNSFRQIFAGRTAQTAPTARRSRPAAPARSQAERIDKKTDACLRARESLPRQTSRSGRGRNFRRAVLPASEELENCAHGAESGENEPIGEFRHDCQIDAAQQRKWRLARGGSDCQKRECL